MAASAVADEFHRDNPEKLAREWYAAHADACACRPIALQWSLQVATCPPHSSKTIDR